MSGKLVRDKIPEIMRADGVEPQIRILDADEYRAALLHKLVEEAREVRASDLESRLGELADVYEVLCSALDLCVPSPKLKRWTHGDDLPNDYQGQQISGVNTQRSQDLLSSLVDKALAARETSEDLGYPIIAVFEALEDLADAHGIEMIDIAFAADVKRRLRGGFDEGIWVYFPS